MFSLNVAHSVSFMKQFCKKGLIQIVHLVCESLSIICARAHKNGRLEEEHVTPIEARSLVKIIELY